MIFFSFFIIICTVLSGCGGEKNNQSFVRMEKTAVISCEAAHVTLETIDSGLEEFDIKD